MAFGVGAYWHSDSYATYEAINVPGSTGAPRVAQNREHEGFRWAKTR